MLLGRESPGSPLEPGAGQQAIRLEVQEHLILAHSSEIGAEVTSGASEVTPPKSENGLRIAAPRAQAKASSGYLAPRTFSGLTPKQRWIAVA